MATINSSAIDLLLKQILAVNLQEAEPKFVNRQLKKLSKLARFLGDKDSHTGLRLKRAEYYLHLNKPARAGKAFSRVLKSGTHEIEAMIGIAESYFYSNKLKKADKWLQNALSFAVENNDYEGQLRVLDYSADRLVISSNKEKLHDILEKMTALIIYVPKERLQFRSTAGFLVHLRRGAECISYLETCIQRLLELGARLSQYKDNLYLLVNAYRQTGMSDTEIRNKLLSLKAYCADDDTLNDYIRRIDWDIERRPYPTLEDEQIKILMESRQE